MHRRLLILVLSLSLSTNLAVAKPKHVAKIKLEDARTTALSKVPGTIKHEELEREHRVWIYSFEIKPEGETGKKFKEVNINADTGDVISIEDEEEGKGSNRK
jgi:uncharacterized membrane protein YkoI